VPRPVLSFRGVAAGSSLLALVLVSQHAAADERRRAAEIEHDAAASAEETEDDDGASAEETRDRAARPGGPPIETGEKRPAVDYDGRGAAPASTGDVLLWVPRILLSPLYLVSEYVVRRPLGWVVTTAEREEIPTLLIDFFTFGPDRAAGIVPTALIDFGLRPSVGLYFFYDGAFHPDNHLRARTAWGGSDWFLFHATDRVEIASGRSVSLKGKFLQRPDFIYHGEGPLSDDDDRGRYFSRMLGGWLEYRLDSWRSSMLDASVGVRNTNYDAARGCCDNPSVDVRVAEGAYPEPVAIDDGFLVFEQSLDLTLDTRLPRHQENQRDASDFESPTGSGLRLDVRALHATSLDRRAPLSGAAAERFHWMRYGGTLGGFLDLAGQQRTLGLSLVVDFADPLQQGGSIPFDELVSLGGARPLRGFLEGRLRGRSAAAAVLEYTWPIWVWLDGSLHYAAGNAFGPQLDGFDAELLRSSFGIGIATNARRDHAFQMLLAFGAERFETGAGIESVRFVLGATDGF
jgi:hypothetical protein